MGSMFTDAFGGGWALGNDINDTIMQGRQRRSGGALSQLLRGEDFNGAAALMAQNGQTSEALRAAQIPMQQRRLDQQQEFRQQEFLSNQAYRQNQLQDQNRPNLPTGHMWNDPNNPAAGVSPLLGYDPQSGKGGVTFGKTPQYLTDPETGELVLGTVGDDGSFKRIDTNGLQPAPGFDKYDVGTGLQLRNKKTGRIEDVANVDDEGAAYNTQRGTVAGKADAEFFANADGLLKQANSVISLVDEAINSSGLDGAVGKWDSAKPQWLLSQDSINFNVRLNQLKGNAFLEAYESLKGGGPITDIEGRKAEAAKFRLDTAQDEKAMRAALSEMKTLMEARVNEVTGKMARLQDKDRARLNPTRREDPNAPARIVEEVTNNGRTKSGLNWSVD